MNRKGGSRPSNKSKTKQSSSDEVKHRNTIFNSIETKCSKRDLNINRNSKSNGVTDSNIYIKETAANTWSTCSITISNDSSKKGLLSLTNPTSTSMLIDKKLSSICSIGTKPVSKRVDQEKVTRAINHELPFEYSYHNYVSSDNNSSSIGSVDGRQVPKSSNWEEIFSMMNEELSYNVMSDEGEEGEEGGEGEESEEGEDNPVSNKNMQTGKKAISVIAQTMKISRKTKPPQALKKFDNTIEGRENSTVASPTVLYASRTKLIRLVGEKKWEKVIQRCLENPEEASMCRLKDINGVENQKNKDSSSLPLYLAIVLHAPVEVIEVLVNAYPGGTKISDCKQMLPLHIAFRLGASPEIAAILVYVYPGALTSKDSKGHTPRHILKSYRREYGKEKNTGKCVTSDFDKNRKELINIYLGNNKSANRSNIRSKDSVLLDRKLLSCGPPSNIEHGLSGKQSEDGFSGSFHNDILPDIGIMAAESLSNISDALKDLMACH